MIGSEQANYKLVRIARLAPFRTQAKQRTKLACVRNRKPSEEANWLAFGNRKPSKERNWLAFEKGERTQESEKKGIFGLFLKNSVVGNCLPPVARLSLGQCANAHHTLLFKTHRLWELSPFFMIFSVHLDFKRKI